MNPYYNDISLFGFFGHTQEFIPNKIENNKYNKIEKIENQIKKVGPTQFIRGELYFYQNIPTIYSGFFPSFIRSHIIDEFQTEIVMDYINGIPLYFLYANQTLTTNIIDKCFDVLHTLHNDSASVTISDEKIRANYFEKIKERYNENDYPFEDADQIYNEIIDLI